VTDGPASSAQGGLVYVPHDRHFTNLHDTPRLRALLQKLNLLT
jgi:hypothetical protein